MATDITPSRTLISGGTIIDGSGAPSFAANLLIEDDRIAAIGRGIEAPGATAVDATGCVVTPGFIDCHCHGDPLATPAFENYTRMGVTTLVLGQDGDSVSEGPLDQWFADARAAGCQLNLVPFAGHGTLRNKAGIGYDPTPSSAQLDRLRGLAREALEEGAYGISLGMEYVPGLVAPFEELRLLAEEAGRAGAIVMSHVRSEDDDKVEAAWGELMELGRAGDCHVHISHMKVTFGQGRNRARQVLEVVEQARRSGVHATGDIYPYTASCTTIGLVFPPWAKTQEGFEKAIAQGRRNELADCLHATLQRRGGASKTLLGMAPYKGITLEQAAAAQGLSPEDLLIEHLGPQAGYAAYFVMDEELQEEMMKPQWVVFSSDGSPEMNHPRGFGTFPRILQVFVHQRTAFTIEEAVAKMTGRTARLLGLDRQQRGLLREGWKADLLVFSPGDFVETATFAAPHQMAEGLRAGCIDGGFFL